MQFSYKNQLFSSFDLSQRSNGIISSRRRKEHAMCNLLYSIINFIIIMRNGVQRQFPNIIVT